MIDLIIIFSEDFVYSVKTCAAEDLEVEVGKGSLRGGYNDAFAAEEEDSNGHDGRVEIGQWTVDGLLME